MGKNKFPEFIIVGAAKSGTTALHHYLEKHPDVFLPKKKELYFWHIRKNPNKSIINYSEGRRSIPQTVEEYLCHYADARVGQIAGEVTPSYLYYYKYTIESLNELHPNPKGVKIIIILRDPVDRIISEYRFVKKLNLDPDDLDLEASLEIEAERLKLNTSLPDLFYADVSLYAEQVDAYKRSFPFVEVVLYDDLKRDAQGLCERLCGFIGVDSQELPSVDKEVHNHSKTRKEVRGIAKIIRRIIGPIWRSIPDCKFKSRMRRMGFIERPIITEEIPDHVMKKLYEKFLPEIEKLEQVTELNLDDWKKRYRSGIQNLS